MKQTAPCRPTAAIRGPASIARAAAVLLVALGGCGADRDYEAAERAHTIVAYDDYLRLHPDGAHARDARARLATLVEEREWNRARGADTADGYQQYLRGYPSGGHAHDALVAIANLNLTAAAASEAARSSPASSGAAVPGGAVKGPIERATAAAAGTSEPPRAATTLAPARGPTPTRTPPSAAPISKPATTSPPPAAAGAVPAEALRGYRVQLGAYAGGSARATAAWERFVAAHPELGTRHPLIAAARTVDGRQVYRLQLGGYTRAAAEEFCRGLAARSEPCVVVAPLTAARR